MMATPEQAELIHDLSIASGNVAGAIEWGSGFVTAERQHREAVQALLAAFARLNARIVELEGLLALLQGKDDTDNGYSTTDNQGEEWSEKYIYDGFGSRWLAVCPKCGAPMDFNRPGDCRCSEECYNEKDA